MFNRFVRASLIKKPSLMSKNALHFVQEIIWLATKLPSSEEEWHDKIDMLYLKNSTKIKTRWHNDCNSGHVI
jgi:hypothetical protein